MLKHNKAALVLGFSLTLTGTSQAAQSSEALDFYGKLDLQALSVNRGLFRYADQGSQFALPFSRLGLKGQQALTDELKVIFVYEWQVNGLDDANKQHRLGARNTYLGLAGSFGELVFGKNDSKFKKSEGKADLFNEYVADIAQLSPGQDRLKNIIGYQSPQWAGFAIAGSYQTSAGKQHAGGYDVSLSYGDTALKKQPIFVAVSMVKELNQLNAKRILLQLPLWQHQHMLLAGAVMWQQSTDQLHGKSGDARMAQLSLQQGDVTAKLQWHKDDSKMRQKERARLLSAGLDYRLSSDWQLYSLVTRLNLETNHDHAVAIGVKYSF